MEAEKLSIMVLEDDSFQRTILLKMLRNLGVKSIFEAKNGIQALDILKSKETRAVDIVVCDINMPEMDGMEFLRHLGTEHNQTSIVLLSTLDAALLASIAKMSIAYGINLLDVIEKPISIEQLKHLIDQYSIPLQKQNSLCEPTPDFSFDEIIKGVHAQQFDAYFQPKLELATGKIIGAEALARWIHPKHGVVPPLEFIDLLEYHCKLDELTLHILKKSIQASRVLSQYGIDITISVNLSLTSLTDVNLANSIIQTVIDGGIETNKIIFEITETAAMTDVAHALENLARLRMNGFGLSIDDYGTGYASMQQLTRIAFTELKIDQSFVQDFITTPALRIMVESSIEIAKKLKVKSVAEGVENIEEWNMLKNLKCDMAQGYFIAKPMALSDFTNFCRNFKVSVI